MVLVKWLHFKAALNFLPLPRGSTRATRTSHLCFGLRSPASLLQSPQSLDVTQLPSLYDHGEGPSKGEPDTATLLAAKAC